MVRRWANGFQESNSTQTVPLLRHRLLIDPSVSDETLLATMPEHPVLVSRPIVCSPKGVRLCRPNEAVLDLLDRLPLGPKAKEDSTLPIDPDGNRID